MDRPFEILFILYEGFDQLDFAGPYEVFFRVPDVNIRLATPDGGDIVTEPGLVYKGMEKLADIGRCDLLCVPGGMDQTSLATPEMIGHIQRLAADASYVTSVCNGSLVLARAGLLEGKRSACHWAFRHQLSDFGAIPDDARVVRDGRFFSGGGVTSGIDFALTVAAEIFGDMTAQMQQLLIEYAPEPPFNAGRPETASREVLVAFDAMFGDALRQTGAYVPEV
ncbi:DJ-1/PfpI family protein [Novosphingobium colocasiae]|uniref:DJ-1/PfpI family protein n=1 Tax=Novosphingobium colocasiae TaxID=1256513 RepID=UPI0035B4C14F